MTEKKKKHTPILRDCSHCHGDGTEDVTCDDCGELLYEDTAADHEEELCLSCAADRVAADAEFEANEPVPKRSNG